MKSPFYSQTSICLAIYLLLSGVFSQHKAIADSPAAFAKYFTVSGKIETSSSYCNGAPPPAELIRRLREKKPHIGYKLYIREGGTNSLNAPIIDSTITDKDGKFEFQLLPGEYILLSDSHKDRTLIRTCLHDKYIRITDFDCIEDWWQNGLAKLRVYDAPIDDLYFHLQKYCSLPLGVPCLQYTGPMPQ